MSAEPEESHIDWANRTLASKNAKYSASVPPAAEPEVAEHLRYREAIGPGGVLQIIFTGDPPTSRPDPRCEACKALKQKLEDTEGALEGAQNIIRQLRDAASCEKEWA